MRNCAKDELTYAGHPEITADGWLRVPYRIGEISPNFCVNCLRPTTSQRSVRSGGSRHIRFGLCEECRLENERERTRFARRLLLSLLAILLLTSPALFLLKVEFAMTAWAGIGGAGTFVIALAAGAHQRIVRVRPGIPHEVQLLFANRSFPAFYLASRRG